jgi:alkanesulfonate monooxygenase SsuD/methylene tetrahydromethanopterin reductase-like flavin-dependent oxidoreductase (luciferase family)
MRVCLMIEGQDDVSWEQWVAIAQAAEAAGLEGLFRSDHYLGLRRHGRVGGLDAWSTIAALAAYTGRIRLGSLVSPVTFRSASVLAKNVVTADHVSSGRIEVGIGAGWYEEEHRVYGFRFPPLRERFVEMESQLAELHRQWSDQNAYWPKPVQRPRPPILIGGLAKRRTVELAVRYADEYNTWLPTVDEARKRAAIVARAAEATGRSPLYFSAMVSCVVGRDASEVSRRLAAHQEIALESDPPPLSGTVAEVADQLARYADAGVDRMMVQQFRHEDLEMIGLLGEVAATLR